jgi:hypothetical protein
MFSIVATSLPGSDNSITSPLRESSFDRKNLSCDICSNVQVSMESVVPPVKEMLGIVLTFPRNLSPDQRYTTSIDMTNSGDDSSCANHALCSNLIGFVLSHKGRDLSILSMTTRLLHYRSSEITIN